MINDNNTFTLTVSQLNKYACSILENDPRLSNIFVCGEISNLKFNTSGHIYFSLKDENASIDAALFRNRAMYLKFRPEDGMSVICRGRVSIYDKTGRYQLYVDDMQPQGAGSLAVAFEQLKKKLENEGLFSEFHKKQLPSYPQKVAVITSSTGAAVKDITSILARRWPFCETLLFPVKVQGEGSAQEICNALTKADSSQCDVIIVGRGGGSAEDLWEFNNEQLARCIYNCNTPIISAVGHETDFTICDFVADVRAATPSAAAELAVPDVQIFKDMLFEYPIRLRNGISRQIQTKHDKLNSIASRINTKRGMVAIENRYQYLDNLTKLLENSFKKIYIEKKSSFELQNALLSAFDPLALLKKGYTSVTKDGSAVRSVTQVKTGNEIHLRFTDGIAKATITETTNINKE